MHIGIDVNEASVVNRVGSNQYAYEILKSIGKLDKKNRFTLYSSSSVLRDMPRERQNWSYKVVKPSAWWTQWRLPLELMLEKEKPDVFLSLGHYAPRWSPVPTVVMIMDLAYELFPDFYRKRDVFQLSAWTKYSVNKAKKVIAISGNTRKDLIKIYGLDKKKIVVVYPGYDRARFKKASSKKINKVRKKYNLSNKYIFYLGTLQPRKNLIRLIEAYEKEFINNEEYGLVISGKEGWMYKDLIQKIENSRKHNFIKLTGFVDNEDVAVLYSAAECFVLPGLYEGFGIPALEAMACETVPVVSNTGALPEAVGDAGILVDPYDIGSIGLGIKKAVKLNPREKRKLNLEARKQLSKFNWAESAQKILEVMYEVAS